MFYIYIEYLQVIPKQTTSKPQYAMYNHPSNILAAPLHYPCIITAIQKDDASTMQEFQERIPRTNQGKRLDFLVHARTGARAREGKCAEMPIHKGSLVVTDWKSDGSTIVLPF